MLSRLVFSLFALSAILVMVAANEHNIPRSRHRVDDLEKRGKPKGKSGTGTWYKPGLGNCGGWNKDKDVVIALPTKAYGKGQYCGKKVKITNKKNGKSVIATCVDSCPTCGDNDADLSPATFSKLAKLDDGVFPMDWEVALSGLCGF
ncbi:hypothetical protein FRC07_014879 [Ceratobasidium sp. 392]|nr:hypothetical protein FRC07_014879 [Ceratobasidium sp. 392]